ncbi:hypothetical protein RRG08_052204 [Elysia crispata]|uniref:Carboxylesterase type B domain-containing protein n=1 Tax=Elysia crispata TaxID=231223 RepID=A0AAE1A0C2_9GAST|nr:hypothetical protein RRG08_052204 [Elysia crispata]
MQSGSPLGPWASSADSGKASNRTVTVAENLGCTGASNQCNTNARVEILDNAVGDSGYKCPALDFAREYTKRGGQVYLYSLEDSISTNPWPKWMGATHGSEIKVELGVPMLPNSGKHKTQRASLSQKFMELLVSFADNG